MGKELKRVRLGHPVPDFTIDMYDAEKQEFGKFDLERQRNAGKWTILFFYPADFTFV